jgi:hypothetical protein
MGGTGDELQESRAAFSDTLNQAGIPGIKYLDGSSRTAVNNYQPMYDAMVKAGNEQLALKKTSPNLWTPDNEELGVDSAISDIVYPKGTGVQYPEPLPEYQDKYGDLGGKKYDALEQQIADEYRTKWINENHPDFTDVTDLYHASPNQQGSAFEAGLKQLGVPYTPNYSASTQSNYFYVENPITKQTEKIRFATHQKQAFDSDEAHLNINPEGGSSSHTWNDAQDYLEKLAKHTAGEGTRNFVMFNPDDIRILERNGQATGQQPFADDLLSQFKAQQANK